MVQSDTAEPEKFAEERGMTAPAAAAATRVAVSPIPLDDTRK